eukprot:c1970_g1_i1 orf=29-235(-)
MHSSRKNATSKQISSSSAYKKTLKKHRLTRKTLTDNLGKDITSSQNSISLHCNTHTQAHTQLQHSLSL